MKKIFGVVFAVLLVIGLTACSGSDTSNSSNTDASPSESSQNEGNDEGKSSNEEVIELSYAFFAPENTFPAVQMGKWKNELEKRTDGKVKVNLFNGGSLLKADNMYDGVKNGVADIGLSATSYEPGRFPLLGISDMPSGYPNSEVASMVVNELIRKYPPEAFSDMKIITSFATEPSFIQSKEPIASLADLRGAQLRISGALTSIMEQLGAAPVGMSQAEVAEAIQTGVIDGNVSSREVLMDLKLAENLKYVTDFPLTVTSFVAVMNKQTWDSLPKDVQQVIDELNAEMGQFTGAYLDQQVEKAMEWSKKEEGLEVVPLTDAADWKEKISTMQDNLVDQLEEQGLPAKEYQETLYELIEKNASK